MIARPLAATVLLLALAAAGAGLAQAPAVVTLMKTKTNPAAEVFWSASGVVDTEDGSQERKPEDDARWLKLAEAAASVRDSGKLMLEAPYARPEPEWRAAAEALAKAGDAGIAAATAKDVDQSFLAGGDMNDACRACHQRFAKRRD